MGKRAREQRANVKGYLRRQGFNLDDLGKIPRQISKTEAWFRTATHWRHKIKEVAKVLLANTLESSKAFMTSILPDIRYDIVESASNVAREEMIRIEDAQAFNGSVSGL